MVYLSLSFDHRVVDGAVGAAFANAIIKQLQNPISLLFSRDAQRKRGRRLTAIAVSVGSRAPLRSRG